MTGLIIALILFPLIGGAVARRNWGEAWLFGAGLCGATLFVAGVLHVPLAAALVILVMAALTRFRQGLRSPVRARWPRAPAIVMFVPLVTCALAATVIPLDDFDGRAFWILKAKGIAHERAIDGPFFHGATVDPRNDYPLLVPIDAAIVFSLANSLDDRQVRWMYLLFLIALALHARERLSSLTNVMAGSWTAALIPWIPQCFSTMPGGALTGYSDLPMGAFGAGAFFELVAAESPVRFGLWVLFIVLTKSEGLPFALIMLMVGAVVFRRRIAVPALMAALGIAALLAWRHGIPRGDEEDLLRLLPSITQKAGRIPDAIATFGGHLVELRSWGLFWVAVGAGAIAESQRRGVRLAIVIIALVAGVYLAVYVATSWHMADLIHASASRLLLHLIGPALFILASAAGDYLPVRAKSMNPFSTSTEISLT